MFNLKCPLVIYQYKVKKDTLYVTKTDSVQVPIQVEQELTQRKNLWFDVRRWFIKIVIITILIIIVKKTNTHSE